MRQVVLDTETTGLEPELDHRVIEIGCVELVNRRATGRHFHRYLNPDRDIDEGALAVHGISRTELDGQPRFAEIAEELLAFLTGISRFQPRIFWSRQRPTAAGCRTANSCRRR